MIKHALLGALALSIAAVTANVRAATPAVGVVFFSEWSAFMDDTAKSIIQQSAETLNAGSKTASITVTGCADTTGSDEANNLLSATRAQVVIDQLVADGVAASRIKRVVQGATPGIGGSIESRRAIISME